MGYLGAVCLPFHSSCQGLSQTHKDPEGSPGPAAFLHLAWPPSRSSRPRTASEGPVEPTSGLSLPQG